MAETSKGKALQLVQRYNKEQAKAKQQVQRSREHLLALMHPDILRPSCWKAINLQEPLTLYKVVATSDRGCCLSVYDGITQYHLAKWTFAKHGAASWAPLYACFYAFMSPYEAITSSFPPDSAMLAAPKVLMQCEAVGESYFNQDTRMWAVSRMRPTKFITQASQRSGLDVHYAVNRPSPEPTSDGAQQVAEQRRGPKPAAASKGAWVP